LVFGVKPQNLFRLFRCTIVCPDLDVLWGTPHLPWCTLLFVCRPFGFTKK